MPATLTGLVSKGLCHIQSGWDQLIQYETITGSLYKGSGRRPKRDGRFFHIL